MIINIVIIIIDLWVSCNRFVCEIRWMPFDAKFDCKLNKYMHKMNTYLLLQTSVRCFDSVADASLYFIGFAQTQFNSPNHMWYYIYIYIYNSRRRA